MPKGVYKRTEKHIELCRKAGKLAIISQFKPGHKVPMKWRKIVAKSASIYFTGRKKELAGSWKGANVKYVAKHKRISSEFGKANKCENCGVLGRKMYHWASINHTYTGNIKDWVQLCVPCHYKYDRKIIKLNIKNG